MARRCVIVLCLLILATAKDDCTKITPHDALFIVDTQNSFIEQFPIPSTPPNYPIPEDWKTADGRAIKPGALAVGNSSQIIHGINDWIDHFTHSGGRVFASLDWHPTDHCSFCRNGSAATNPSGFHPQGAVCPGLPVAGFNDTGRCADPVAVADYSRDDLVQWPDHCVQQTFGARFSPYLRMPESAVVVKKGFLKLNDTYSAFGGTHSAQSFPFDTQDTQRELADRATLTQLLEDAQIRRMWVVGLATDFCVGGTVLDALGANQDTGRSAPVGLEKVVLVSGCIRAVGQDTGAAMIGRVKHAGGVVVEGVTPIAGIDEACHVHDA